MANKEFFDKEKEKKKKKSARDFRQLEELKEEKPRVYANKEISVIHCVNENEDKTI